MALARLPDSKRDSNTKSSSVIWPVFGCAFIMYLALPMLDRLNCVISNKLSLNVLWCAFILLQLNGCCVQCNGGGLHVTCAVGVGGAVVVVGCVILSISVILHMPFESDVLRVPCNA